MVQVNGEAVLTAKEIATLLSKIGGDIQEIKDVCESILIENSEQDNVNKC